LAGDRCPITEALPHFRHRSRFAKLAIGAPGLSPNFINSCPDKVPRCSHFKQRMRMTPFRASFIIQPFGATPGEQRKIGRAHV
jgi:hypothetical protein